MSRRLLPALLLLLGTSACGYRVVDPAAGGGRSLAVPTADNDSRWRGIEASFTRSLRSDFQRLLDVRLTGEAADYTLHSSIHDALRDAPVRDPRGGALLGRSVLIVDWSLEDRSGQDVASGSLRRELEFLPSAGEDARRTFDEILDWMSESVVLEAGMRLEALSR